MISRDEIINLLIKNFRSSPKNLCDILKKKNHAKTNEDLANKLAMKYIYKKKSKMDNEIQEYLDSLNVNTNKIELSKNSERVKKKML